MNAVEPAPLGPGKGGRLARRRGFLEYGLVAGELGGAAVQSLMLTLLPILLQRYTRSPLAIGFVVGSEGIFTVTLPYWVGLLSDRLGPALTARVGRRVFFLLAAAPVMVAMLVLLPFLHGFWPLAGASFVVYAAFQGYMTPLAALMVDSVPDERRGRVQGVRGTLRAAGLAYGLVGGGLLYALGDVVPFAVGGALLLVTTAVSWRAARVLGKDRAAGHRPAGFDVRAEWTNLKANRRAVWFIAANALWNAAIDGMRPFFLIFAQVVVGISIARASLLASVLVVGLAIGSLVLGRLGDRYDRARLLQAGAGLLAVAFGAATFVRGVPGALVVMVLAGTGASAFLALAYPYFARLSGASRVGQYAGLFTMSTGIGRLVSPQLVGLAIEAGRPVFPRYRGYPFMWPVPALLALLGLFALRHAEHARVETR